AFVLLTATVSAAENCVESCWLLSCDELVCPLFWLLSSFWLLGEAPGVSGAFARVSVSFFVLTAAASAARAPPGAVRVPPRPAVGETSMSLAATAAPNPRRAGPHVSQSAAT